MLDAGCRMRLGGKRGSAEGRLLLRARSPARAMGIETGRDDPCLTEAMVEDDEAVVEAHGAIGQFEIVHRAAGEFWLHEILKIVTPVSKAAAKRKRKIGLVEHLVAFHQAVEHVPRIAEQFVRPAIIGQLAPRAEGAEREKRSRGDERIPRLW